MHEESTMLLRLGFGLTFIALLIAIIFGVINIKINYDGNKTIQNSLDTNAGESNESITKQTKIITTHVLKLPYIE